jgi:hypothetical protein
VTFHPGTLRGRVRGEERNLREARPEGIEPSTDRIPTGCLLGCVDVLPPHGMTVMDDNAHQHTAT